MNTQPQNMIMAGAQGSPQNATKRAYDKFLLLGFVLVALLFFVGFVWATLTKIQGAVISTGQVVVEGRPKVVQHLDGGVVGEILVREGDRVGQGDVLIRLDPTSLTANETLLQNRLNEALGRKARLTAERDEASSIDWDSIFPTAIRTPEIEKVISDQTELFETRRTNYRGEVSQLYARIDQARDQIAGYESRLQTAFDQAKLVNDEANAFRELNRRGQGYAIRINQLEREFARLQGEIATTRSEIARTNGVISETEIEISQVRRRFQEQVLTDLRTAESEVSDLTEQLTQAKDQTGRIEITAPVDGIVHNMQISTIGGVITPANPIMEIIPVDDNLVVEGQVDVGSIDQIYLGQPTRVRLSAFNQNTTPELKGTISRISANAIVDERTGMSFYTVRIAIPTEEIDRLQGLTLIPGMPAESFIQTEERTVWSYLIKPASDSMNRAFREE